MRLLATDGMVCLSISLLVIAINCLKTAELIEILFWAD